jgi:hypothetical protein
MRCPLDRRDISSISSRAEGDMRNPYALATRVRSDAVREAKTKTPAGFLFLASPLLLMRALTPPGAAPQHAAKRGSRSPAVFFSFLQRASAIGCISPQLRRYKHSARCYSRWLSMVLSLAEGSHKPSPYGQNYRIEKARAFAEAARVARVCPEYVR